MTKEQLMVAAFHNKFGIPNPKKPNISLDEYRGFLRSALIQEEADEFSDAWKNRDIVEMIDALCDVLYVTYGAAVELGVDLEPFFQEVHRSNMLKEGGPSRADGKLLKPEGWEKPKIAELLSSLVATNEG